MPIKAKNRVVVPAVGEIEYDLWGLVGLSVSVDKRTGALDVTFTPCRGNDQANAWAADNGPPVRSPDLVAELMALPTETDEEKTLKTDALQALAGLAPALLAIQDAVMHARDLR